MEACKHFKPVGETEAAENKQWKKTLKTDTKCNGHNSQIAYQLISYLLEIHKTK